jgi:nitroimidazol reductase NimA-like FMN-containing flavoprotein (pyridoxamine 5'-phosphate oxidase superfamily)
MMQREHRPADRIRIRRNPKKGRYEPATIDAILDRGLVAHVAFVDRREPVCIQMLYGRIDRKLYIHGSRASRMMRLLAAGRQACLTVTLMQGLVIARSAFEHSANYESVVVFGRFAAIEGDDERLAALAAFTNKLLPGRWDEVRQPNAKELNRAGVARATVFSRFGSKLGVLEALSMRCAGGPEMRAVREAQRVEDPVAAVEALLVAAATCGRRRATSWSSSRRSRCSSPTRAGSSTSSTTTSAAAWKPSRVVFKKPGPLREGWTVARATAALHALTSVETFMLLRRDHGLPLAKVKQTIVELSRTMLAEQEPPKRERAGEV